MKNSGSILIDFMYIKNNLDFAGTMNLYNFFSPGCINDKGMGRINKKHP